MTRPSLITRISGGYIAFGFFMLFGGSLVLSLIAPSPYLFALAFQDRFGEQALSDFLELQRYAGILGGGPIFVGIAAIVGGIGFLTMQAWARHVLEVLAWIFLVQFVVTLSLWCWLLVVGGVVPWGLVSMGIAAGLIVLVVVLIRTLRRADVRSLVSHDPSLTPHGDSR